MSGGRELNPETAIAVVGMACRFPGARNVGEFWRNLRDGVESVEDLSDEEILAAGENPELLAHPDYVKRASALSGMALWDHGFFGLSPKEAAVMDPQHRHFLELSWEALEDAGYAPGTFGGPVGVFAGCGANTYMMFNLMSDPDLLRDQGFFLLRHIGNDKDFLATRVSYHFNLTGPGINVQTACSTSLAAIHLATQSLLAFECDMALAGGVTITHPHRRGYLYKEGEILSPDGRCRAFDAASGGTVLGDGAGAVILRRLEDAMADGDTIHAVIRGTAINNDGSGKVGYLAPSVDGQSEVVAEALAVADVDPATIGYVEAHGTGTRIGDPIEVAALTRAFRTGTDRVGYCGLGSVKTNIGHLDTAAGVAGFMKAVLALRHGEIPPTLHFREPNPELALESSPFRVVSERTPWARESHPRRAGVSSLGVGGTNVHLVLEEAPAPEPSGPARRSQLFLLSGRSRAVVGRAGARLVDHLEENPGLSLPDVAYTLQAGRASFQERRVLVADDTEGVVDALVTGDPEVIRDHTADDVHRDVAFLFAGGGAQYPGMARGLYGSEAGFRERVDGCLERLEPELRAQVRSLLLPDAPGAIALTSEEVERPSIALPALFIVQYAQAELWMSWGVRPAAMIGHSMGEYTAACLAGVFSLEEALELVVLRGRLFEQVSGGGMLSVPLAEAALRPLLGDELSVAAVNAPELCVASGPRDAIDGLEKRLAEQEIDARRIHIDVAAHSSMLEPILKDFGARLSQARMHPPEIPFASNLTGGWIGDDDATDPAYWVRQLRETVRFSEGLAEVLTERDRVLLEVGPGRTLATLARLHPDRDPKQETFTSLRHPDDEVDDMTFLLNVVGGLWQHGVEVDWKAFHGEPCRHRISLPTYPFESERHFVEGGPLPSTHRMQVVEGDAQVEAAGSPGASKGASRSDGADAVAVGAGAERAPTGAGGASTDRGDGRVGSRDGVVGVAASGITETAPGGRRASDPAPASDPTPAAADGPSTPEAWLHGITWVEAPLSHPEEAESANGSGGRIPGGSSLVIGSADMVDRVAEAVSGAFPGEPVTRVTFGEHFQRTEGGWTLVPGDLDDAARLMEAVIDEVGLPARIVYAGALGLRPLSPDALPHDPALTEAEDRAFFGLFALGRALAEQVDDDEVELVVLTEGAVGVDGDPETAPAGSLVAGPVRVLPAEVPGIRTRWIDLPLAGLPAGESGVAALVRELVHGAPSESGPGETDGAERPSGVAPGTDGRVHRVALRPSGRFVPFYSPVAPAGGADGDDGAGPLPDDAVCLVTGGFGGLGLEVARHLARRSDARIVLLGRTPLPERKRWDGAEARGEDPRILRAISVIRELEASGARVLPLAADVTDEAGLRQVRERIESEFGAVDVIVHAAGVLEDDLAFMKEAESARRVLAPKVRGTLALARVFRDPAPSRLVLFSSVSAEAGLPGQVDYTSANAFLDAFALAESEHGSARTTSIGWSAWRETGMAVDAASGLVHWPPLVDGSGGEGGRWSASQDPRFDASDREGGRVRVRLREGRLWLLDEHRTRDGTPLVPGAGFMELLRAATVELGGGGRLRLEELYFLAPFLVPRGETREMEIRVPAEGEGEAVVLGRGRPDEAWVEHVKGRVRRLADDSSDDARGGECLGAIRDRTRALSASEWTGRQDLDLGPRWDNLRGMAVGEGEVLLTLELGNGLEEDLGDHPLHPALLDNATAVAGPLLPGFGERGTIHVPASYGSFEIHAPLPARVRSHIRLAESEEAASDEMTALDVTLYDEAGRLLVEARSFILVRIETGEITRVLTEARDVRSAREATVSAAAAEGVPTRIGLGIVDLALGEAALPRHLLVSPEPMTDRIRTLRERAGATGSRGSDGPDVDVRPVEAALEAMEAVTEAAVTAHEDRPGEIRLVAHVVLDSTVFATVSELRRGLRSELPSELVPQNFVQLDALPRTARGTVKRRALTDPFAPVDDYVAPETPTQEVVAGIWAELLGAERVGIHDNFLDVGGHSLLAMRAILRTEKATGVRLGPVEMNLYTLEQIAAHIDAEGGGAPAGIEEAPEVSSPTEAVAERTRTEDPSPDASARKKRKAGRSGFLDTMRKLIPGA